MRTPFRQIRGLGIRRTVRTGLVTFTALLTIGALASVATADGDDTVPSQADVDAARQAAQDKAGDVASVQADLLLANQRLQNSEIAAGKAAEAYNGARWKLEQARVVVRAAERRERLATAAVARQQAAYGDALASSYEMAPQLTAMSAMLDADGPSGVMERYTTLDSAESAMDSQYDDFRATSTLATVATAQAEDARAAAATLEREADAARDQAQAAADAAASEEAAVAAEKTRLIGELATLQHISVTLAGQRQAALEAAAAQAAAEAAQQAAEQAAQQAAEEAAQQAAEEAAQEAEQNQPSGGPGDGPSDPPSSDPTDGPSDPPTQDPPPASGGAQRAVNFAKAQIGDPYVYGAAGPNAWDCSGLTMGAWLAGGKSLPHYSVAQYEQSTPISPSDLKPGDLVFWGDNGNPSSIYHVALYAGNGMIVQAPRPGRDVEYVSMYYWIAPNFYARP